MLRLVVYLAPVGLIVLVIVLALHLRKHEGVIHLAVAALALLVAAESFVFGFLESRRQHEENRPVITGWVSAIDFSPSGKGAPAAPPGMSKATFSLVVENAGNQETMLVAFWLVPRGSSRDKAESLLLTPGRLMVPARTQADIAATLIDTDAERFRGTSATIHLRDASQREYPIDVVNITQAHFGRPVSEIPVRRE